MRSAKTRIFVFLTLVILTAVFSASALTASNDQARLGESGSFSASIFSFLGFTSQPATGDMSGVPSATPPDGGDVHSTEKESNRAEAIGVCAAPPAGLTGWYKFDTNYLDHSGAPFSDASGNATFFNENVEGIAHFGGAASAVAAVTAETNVGSSPAGMTIEGWIQPHNNTSSPLVEWGNAGNVGVHFWHSVGAAGQLYLNLVDSGGVNRIVTSTGNPITVNDYQHVGFTYDRANGRIQLYYAGAVIPITAGANTVQLDANTVTVPPGTVPQTTFPLNFAIRPSGVPIFYNGDLDDIAIYNRPLAPGEINDTFTSGVLGKCLNSIGFASATSETVETTGQPLNVINYTLNRTGDTNQAASIQVNSAPGTALGDAGSGCAAPGSDFQNVPTNSIVNFAAGATSAVMSVTICNNTTPEPSENYFLTLSNPIGANTGTSAAPTITTNTTTIIDDDSSVALTATVASVTEGGPVANGTDLEFTFTRPAADAFDLPVNIQIDGFPQTTAEAGDFTVLTTGTCNAESATGITIPSGAASCTLLIEAEDDLLVEPDETVSVRIMPANTYTITGTNPRAGTIVNDDFSTISVAVGNGFVDEGDTAGGQLTYVFSRPAGAAGTELETLTVNFAVSSTSNANAICTAGGTQDYTVLATTTEGGAVTFNCAGGGVSGTGTIVFQGTQTTATLRVNTVPNRVVESDENVIVTVADPTNPVPAPVNANNYVVAAAPNNTATGWIDNDDEDVSISPANATTPEAGANMVFTLTRTGDSVAGPFFNRTGGTLSTADALDVSYTLGGSAVNGTDYANLSGTASFAAGVLTTTIVVDPTDDNVPENNEDVIIQIVPGNPPSAHVYGVGQPNNGSNPQVIGAGWPANSTATGIITNDDFWVAVQVSAPSSVNEGTSPGASGVLTYTFTRIGQTADQLCANFQIDGGAGHANAADDYGVVFNPAGAGAFCTSNFTAVANANSPGIIGIPGAGANLTNASVLVTNAPVVLGVQANTATMTVTASADNLPESDELVRVVVINDAFPADGKAYIPNILQQADGTIINDDSQRVAVSVDGPVNEGNPAFPPATGPGVLTFTFTRTLAADFCDALSVNYGLSGTIDGADFTSLAALGNSNIVSFPANAAGCASATSQTVTVTVTAVQDTTPEANESAIVTVFDTADYTANGGPATGVFLNDDTTVTCTALATPISETGGSTTSTCTRSTPGSGAGNGVGQNAALAALTVVYGIGGTATNGVDYTLLSGTMTFAGTDPTATVTVTAISDALVEGDETVSLTFNSQLVGGVQGVYFDPNPTVLSTVIADDDNDVSVIVTSPASRSVFENAGTPLVVTFSRSAAGAHLANPLTVGFSVAGTACDSNTFGSPCTPSAGGGPADVDYDIVFPPGTTGTYDPETGTGTIVIPGSASSPGTASLHVVPRGDTFVEPDETVIFDVTETATIDDVGGTLAERTGTILNDDNAFSVVASPASGNEGHQNGKFLNDGVTQNTHGIVPEPSGISGGPTNTDLTPHGSHAVFVVTRTGNLSNAQTIDIGTIPTGSFGEGTATSGPQNSACGAPGVDYITDGETFTFPAVANTFGTQTFYHFVAVCGDIDVEVNETINVKLSNPTSVPGPFSTSIPSPNSGPHATYTIVNDDGQGKGGIWVRATNVKVVEPAGGGTVVANFQVCAYTSATGNTVATNVATPIYFDYITQDGTQVLPSGNQTNTSNPANAGSDYGETSSSLTDDDIAISPSTGCSPLIPVTVNSDSLVEGQENYFLRVFNVNPGAGNSFGSAIPNIANALDTRTTGTGFTSDVLSPPALIINGYNGNQPVPNAVGSVGLINETGAANSYYVTDVAQAEGNGGDNATTFIHYLRKNGTAQESQTVCWRTQNGNTAVTGGGANPALGGASATTVYDYTIVNPSNVSCHTFDSNTPDGFSLPINIVVNGDVYYEKDDTYTVELISISPNTVGSTFAANPSHPGDPNYIGKGIGTIQNDDLVPTVGLVNIGNSQRLSVENDSGTFSIPVEFSVSGPTLIPVTVNYDVTAGGAPAGSVAAVVGPDGGPCGSQTASTARDLYQPTTGSSASPVLFSSGTPISKVVAGNALSFPGQDQAGTYSINLVGCGDTRPEPDENFTVTITSAVEALVAPNGTGSSGGCSTSTSALCGNKVGIIRDTDWNGVFNFSDANGLPPVNVTLNDGDVSLAEGSTVGGTTNFDFYVRYTGRAADYEISMVLETVDGTAQDDVPSSDDNDYVPRNNLSGNRCEVTFPAGSNEPQLCRILVNNDAVQELDETFTLQVTNITTPAGAFLSTSVIGYGPGDLLNPKGRVVTFSNLGGFGTDLIAQGNILNDDGSRVVSVNARTLAEGTDAGATTAFVHRVEIQGSSNQAAVFTYQVIGPSSSLGLTAVGGMNCSGANSGSPDFINTPQLAPGSYPAGTGLVATSGTTGTLTFGPTGGTGPGFEYIDILVPVCADTRDEPNETYRVVLTAVSNVTVSTGSGNGLGTINNDDGVQYSLLTNPININEGDTVGAGQSATVTLVRSGNTSNAATFTWYTVNGPAPDPPGLGTGAVGGSSCNTGSPQTGDPDFISQGSAGSPLNGPGYSAGQTGNRTVQVPICGDTVQEGNQSFTVVITPSDGAPLTATVNIIEESTDQAPPPPAGIEGDVVDGSGGAAGDGLVAANDVSALRAALLAGTQPFAVGPGSSQFSRADINNPCGNGGLDVGDLAYMRQLALSLATPLAVCGPLVPTAADPVEEGNRAENVRVIRVVNSKVAITPGTPPPATVTFPIEMVSTGIETGASFSISWDVTKFTYNTSAVGNGVPGDTQFDPITTQTGQGRLGMFINSPNSFVAGTRQLATVTLNVLPSVTAGTYPVTFGGQPTAIFVSGVNGADVTSTTTFEPGNIVVNTTAAGVRISGRVTNAGGQGIRNAVVVMTDAEGNRRTATTGSFGIYTFEDVEVGSSYVIGVEAKRYRFASRVLNVNDSLTDVNFVGQE